MSGTELRRKRMAAGIPAAVVAKRVGKAQSKISDIERGYVAVSDEEAAQISNAIDSLAEAKAKVVAVAAAVGWPVEAF